MFAKVWKLITLLALLLMPFGMAPAAATSNQGTPSAMPMQHCPEQQSNHASGAFGECMMACSAALPATEPSQSEPVRIVCLPIERPLARALIGLHPDIATPPPREG
jgi:hypothetical protein